LELVWVSEGDLDEWCASAGIVDDVLHYTSNVSMLFGKVELSELGWGFVQSLVGSCTDTLVVVANSENDLIVLKIEPRPFLWLRITLPMLREPLAKPLHTHIRLYSRCNLCRMDGKV